MRVFPELLSRPALSKAGISGSNIAGRMGKTIGCPRSLPALVWFASVSIIRRTRLLWTREDRMRTNCCKALVAVSALLLSVGIAGAAEVTLISVGGVKVALDKIVADYTKATSNQVKYTVGSPLIVSKKLADGEAFDVVVQSVPAMDDYAKLGGVKADTRVKVARGGIGMAIRKEATPPDISTPDAFKKALMQATSIAMTDTAMPNGSSSIAALILTDSGKSAFIYTAFRKLSGSISFMCLLAPVLRYRPEMF